MHYLKIVSITLLSVAFSVFSSGSTDYTKDLDNLSLHTLEELRNDIEVELSRLAYPSLNSGVGAVGFRSLSYTDPVQNEWVEVDLLGTYVIDSIIIIPTLWRDTELGFIHDAFPVEFRVIIGTEDNKKGEVIYEYNADENKFTGIAPLLISVESKQASWVKIEANRLSARAYDNKFVFQISELMVFEGEVNRALRKPVTVVDDRQYESPAHNVKAMVDGILPYLMNAASDEENRAYVSPVGIGDTPSITIDLLEQTEVSGLRLHNVDQSDTVPATNAGEFGLPKHFILEGSLDASFETSTLLLEAHLDSVFEMGPFISWQFPEKKVRYIRLTALDPYVFTGKYSGTRIGFAEIEILKEGLNVSFNKPVTTNFNLAYSEQSLPSLTDGLNLYGEILSQKQWLYELVSRHELETYLKVFEIELSKRYASQRTLLRWVTIAAVCFLLLIVFMVPYYRMLSYRKEVRIRERIAANLHDELGANLHAIGMLGDVAERSVQSPKRLIESVRRIRSLTERTGAAARYCTNMLEAKTICEDVVSEIKQDAKRLLSDHNVRMVIQGQHCLQALNRREKVDLYLFFKECLTNINKHAMATEVYIRITAGQQSVSISVIDNGCGHNGGVPKSLSRRARLMSASVRSKKINPSGTHIRLKLKRTRFKLFQ